MVLLACGYRFGVGTGQLPDGGRRLSIEVAENLTTDAWAGAWLTEGLRREAIRAGLEVVYGADAPHLDARVVFAEPIPRGVAVHAGRFRAREQELVVKVELAFRHSTGHQNSFALDARESYLSAPDLRGTEANRLLALRKALDRLSRDAIDRLSRSFGDR
jgi:hypothetical protein